MHQDTVNLTAKQHPDSAIFLPAISTYYVNVLSKHLQNITTFDNTRLPENLNDLSLLNFLNQRSLFPYQWTLYSAGHVDLSDINSPAEHIIQTRDRSNTFLLADSGGFQIMRGHWRGDWKDPTCKRAHKRRVEVLHWMEHTADYAMVLDIPSDTVLHTDKVHRHGIRTIEDALTATTINNNYFIDNRQGKCKFLNVLQGHNHNDSEEWFDYVKDYCDPKKYPANHFNGWAFGGQTKTDVHLFIKLLLKIIHGGYLQQGIHDWVHCLGISIVEWGLVCTDIQRAIRKYHNPSLTISFDSSTPFYVASRGHVYYNCPTPHNKKWPFSMNQLADNQEYATSDLTFHDAILSDPTWSRMVHNKFTDSPVTKNLKMRDVCYRGIGSTNQYGKPINTSWDTLSYVLMQAHNAFMHINCMQNAYVEYASGNVPKMLHHAHFDDIIFSDVIDDIFRQPTLESALSKCDSYSYIWDNVQSNYRGLSGKNAITPITTYNRFFE